MNVRELRELLAQYPGDMPAVIYNDLDGFDEIQCASFAPVKRCRDGILTDQYEKIDVGETGDLWCLLLER